MRHPNKSFSLGTHITTTETVKRDVKAKEQLPSPSLPPPPTRAPLLSSRFVGSRNSTFLSTIAGLRHLFFQYLSQPEVCVGLLSKEAPNDQSQEGQA